MDLSAPFQPPESIGGRIPASAYRVPRGNTGEACKILLEPVGELPVYRYEASGRETYETTITSRNRRDILNDRIREHANRLCSQRNDDSGVVRGEAVAVVNASDVGKQRSTLMFAHLARKLRKCYGELAELTDMLNMCRPVEIAAEENSNSIPVASASTRNDAASRNNASANGGASVETHLSPYFLAQLSTPAPSGASIDSRQLLPAKFDPFSTIAPPAEDLQATFAHVTRKKKTVFAVASTIASASSAMRALISNASAPLQVDPTDFYPYSDAGPYVDENTRRLAQRAMKAHMPIKSIISNIINADDIKRSGIEFTRFSGDNLQRYDCVHAPCSSPRFFHRFLLHLHREYPLTSYAFRKKSSFLANDADDKNLSLFRFSGAASKLSNSDFLNQPLEAEILEITGLLGLIDPAANSATSDTSSAVDHVARYTIVYDSLNSSQQVGCYAPRFTTSCADISSNTTSKTIRLVFEVTNRNADKQQDRVVWRAAISQPLADPIGGKTSSTFGTPHQSSAGSQTLGGSKQKQDILPKKQPFSQTFQADDAVVAGASVAGVYNMSMMQDIFSFLHAKRAECFCVDSFRLLQRELAASSVVVIDGGDDVRNHGVNRFPPANVLKQSIQVNLFGSYVLCIKLEEYEKKIAAAKPATQHDRKRHATLQSSNSNISSSDTTVDDKPGPLGMAISRALLAALMMPPPFVLASRAVNAAGAVDFFTSSILRGKHDQQNERQYHQRSDRLRVSGSNEETASARILKYINQYLACYIVRQCVDESATLSAPDPQLILRSTSVCSSEGSIHATSRLSSSTTSSNAAEHVDDDALCTVYRLRCYTSGFDHLNVKSNAVIVTIRQLDVVFHTRDGWTRSCRADCRVTVLNALNICCARYNSQLLLVYFSGLGWPCSGIRLMQPVVCTDFTEQNCAVTPVLTLPPAVAASNGPTTTNLTSSACDTMPPFASTTASTLINDEEALYYDYFVQVQNPRKDLHVIMQISVDRPKRMVMCIRPPKCVAITIAREKIRQQRKRGLLLVPGKPGERTAATDSVESEIAMQQGVDIDERDADERKIIRDWLNAPFIYPVCTFYDHMGNTGSTGDSSGYRTMASSVGKKGGDGSMTHTAPGKPETNAADPRDAVSLAASDAATGRLQDRKHAWLDDADAIYESTLYYVALDQLFDLIDIGTGDGSVKESHAPEEEDAVARFARHVMDRMRGVDKMYQAPSSFLNKLDLFISSPMINNLE